jgi:hypothetical protein
MLLPVAGFQGFRPIQLRGTGEWRLPDGIGKPGTLLEVSDVRT